MDIGLLTYYLSQLNSSSGVHLSAYQYLANMGYLWYLPDKYIAVAHKLVREGKLTLPEDTQFINVGV